MYKCECGKDFEKKQSFVAHCSHCKYHLNEKQIARRVAINAKFSQRRDEHIPVFKEEARIKREAREKAYITKWKEGRPRCEHCGKLLIEYYGSGRFCNEVCSRAFSSKIAKQNPESLKAFSYARGTKKGSPHEYRVAQMLDAHGLDYIHNATRTQYTDISPKKGPGRCVYVLDFFLPDYQVDLEVDGRLHEDKVAHDFERDEYLKSIGISTYRIKMYGTDNSVESQFFNFLIWLENQKNL